VAPFDEAQARRHQQAWADHLGVDVEITNSIGMRLVLIPPGEFLMGSPESEDDRSDDEYQHRVRITKPFHLGSTEVTQGQWQAVMGTRPWSGQEYVREDPDHAASYVNWEDAQAFCQSISSKERGTYRLPSEAEWEYACRAGTTTAYCSGDDTSRLGDYAWFEDNADDMGEKYAHRVGQKKPNPFGLFDMHGNVAEWCQDCYGDDYYAGSPTDDPTGPEVGLNGVDRGGSWYVRSKYCRSACRGMVAPSFRRFHLGFRVAVAGWRGTRTSGMAQPTEEPEEPTPAAGIAKEKLARRPTEPAEKPAKSPPADNKAPGKPAEGKPAERKRPAKPPRRPELAVAPFDETEARRHQKAWADHLGVDVEITNSIGMRLVLSPPGEFMMGSPEKEKGRYGGEYQHRVRITKPFHLGVCEVTQGQWRSLMGTRPWEGKRNMNEGGDYPALCVTWEDALRFCQQLSQLTQESRVGRVYRLPTEAEWEYACRAGTTTAYSFGDDPSELVDHARFASGSGGEEKYACRVGQKKQNAFGLYDMHGNVSEHCQDWYDSQYYRNSPENDPSGPVEATESRVLRGGNWTSSARFCRSAVRSTPSFHNEGLDLGFRLALIHPNEKSESEESPAREISKRSVAEAANAGTEAPLPAMAPFDSADAEEHQKAWADHLGLDVEITNSIGMRFVLIPPGEFMMGSPESEAYPNDDESEHRVRITRPFYLGIYEVTQAEYVNVMRTRNPSRFSSAPGQDSRQFPVETVSWDDAVTFCRKLSSLSAEQDAGRVYQLPTEAQWEYACRAGASSAYHFGSSLSLTQANYGGYNRRTGAAQGLRRPTSVGSYLPNAWRLYDMHGNVEEWCADAYESDYYDRSPRDDPMCPRSIEARVFRGGSWFTGVENCRSAHRSTYELVSRHNFLGFRVVAIQFRRTR